MFFKKKALFFLIVLLLIVKLPVFLSLFPTHRDSDELAYGAVGKTLLDGFSLLDYQLTTYGGGKLIIAVLIAPFFLKLSGSLFSLKLISLLFLLATLVLLYFFMKKFFSKKAAVISCLLYICSPLAFTKRSVILLSNHFESILFIMLALYIFYEIIFSDKTEKKYFIIFGLICGLGVSFSYSFLVMLLLFFLFWFARSKKFFLNKGFFIFSLFLFIGLSPWLVYNLKHEFFGAILHDELLYKHFFQSDIMYWIGNLMNILVKDLPGFFQSKNDGTAASRLFSYTSYLLCLVSFYFVCRLNRKSIMLFLSALNPFRRYNVVFNSGISKETLLLIYPVIFCLIYSLSDLRDWVRFDSESYSVYRYLVPLFPFFCMIISLFLDKVRRGHKAFFIFSQTCFLFFLINGLVSNFSLISFKNFGMVLKYKGYSYHELGRLIGENNFYGRGNSLDLINKFYRKYKTLSCYEGIGYEIARRKLLGAEIKEDFQKVEISYRPYCYYGLGQFIGEIRDIQDFAGLMRILGKIEKKNWPEVIEGIGLGLWLFDDEKINLVRLDKWLNNIPGTYKKYFYRGVLESSFSSNSGFEINRPFNLIAVLPKEYKSYSYEGLGAAIAEVFGDNLEESEKLINKIDKEFRAYCYNGFAETVNGARIYEAE